MNSKRSYLDAINAGRQRRPQSSLDEINKTLDRLGQRFERHSPEFVDRPVQRSEDRLRRNHEAQRRTHGDDVFAREQRLRGRDPAGATIEDLARSIESARRQEEGVASISKIAGELKSMREELRHQMGDGLRREFEALRGDIERAVTGVAGTSSGEHLTEELERLSDAIRSLAEGSDDRGVGALRKEIDLVRESLDRLASGDISTERRWDDFDRRFDAFEERFASGGRDAADPALDALNARLEEITSAVNNLPESLSLRTLEDKVRTLAGAVDHFSRQQQAASPGAFAMIEERLDEISRAIIASSVAAQAPYAPLEQFERIEARIASLARQIDELADDRPTGEVIDRINMLSQRVDEMARRAEFPERAVEKLADQVATIAARLESGLPASDAEHVVRGLEQRFSSLTDVLQRQQGEALQRDQSIFRELETRLEALSTRLEQPDSGEPSAGFMNAIDARFEELTRRFDTAAAGASPDRFKKLESRLEEISSRLDTTSGPGSSLDAELIRSLEEQVAGLTAHMSKPGAPLPEFEDIGPRLAQIERSLDANKEAILSSARAVAEEAIRSLPATQNESPAVAALAEDLKSLDALTRRSDERNARTFEAIHDTLIKIVDRLGTIETRPVEIASRERISAAQTPSTEPSEEAATFGLATPERVRRPGGRSPAEAAAAAASAALSGEDDSAVVIEAVEEQPSTQVGKRSVLGGLARALTGRRDAKSELAGDAAATPRMPRADFDLDEALDPKLANQPLEPGSGAPDLNAIMKRVRDERGLPSKDSDSETAKSDFIAAARRAAQAAAAEADSKQKGFERSGHATSSGLGRIFKNHRKMALMAAGMVVLALAGMQLGKAFLSDSEQIAMAEPEAAQAEPAGLSEAAELEVAEVTTTGGAEEAAMDGSLDEPIEDDPAADEAELAPADEPASDEVRMVASGEDGAPAAQTAPPTTGSLPQDSANVPEETLVALAPGETSAETPSAPAVAEPAPAFEVPAEAGPVPLREAAEGGDPRALFEIGSRYAEGRGTKQDQAEAAKWYERSAEAGFAPAQYRIGNYYEKGTGVERDVAKAKTWYQMAAEQGNASAMHNLAVLYAMGADGTTDNESAGRWFVRAAELGVRDSQYNLGILSAKGIGVPQSLEESYKWFALVAKAGDKDAATKRDEVANALRPEQLAKARAATELWKPKEVVAEANNVVVPEEWTESQGKTASVDMKQAVRNIQLILNKNGYNAGGADGVMGEKTKSAIAAFQSDNGLAATGEVTEELVHALLKKK